MPRLTRFLGNLFADAPRTARRPSLGLHQLEAREVPAIALVGDVLTITATDNNDTVTVVATGLGTATTADDNIVATHTYKTFLGTTVTDKKTYNTGYVGSVDVTLNAGHDYFDNDSSKKTTVRGGSGNDELRGGGGADLLYGESGNDRLYGGGGNDQLYGGTGNDRMYGMSGSDILSDPSGTNGLYGGGGTDTLMGGTGSDRYLDPAGDAVFDAGGSDALIDFNGTAGLVTANFGDGTATYLGAGWTETEVIRVDGGLAAVHEGMGNPAFLKYDGASIDVRKVGQHLSGPSGVLGWNGDTGVITITQLGLDQVDGDLAHTVIHEIGHNWDEADENSSIGQFRSISGWLPRFSSAMPTPPGYAVSGDGDWFHKADAKFTRGYAKTNPKEDFADSFAAFWLHKAGIESGKLALDFNDLPQKMAYMQDFVNTL